MSAICLITTGQPSTNPRLVKEADALVEAGHTVRVVCAHWAPWADVTDHALLQSRSFGCSYVGGRSGVRSISHLWTRVRHRVGRELVRFHGLPAPRGWALSRVTPDLQRAAERVEADLYIAHNVGALPAAAAAAARHHAAFGFDAEDFHSGMLPRTDVRPVIDDVIEETERELLPRCDYVTAASPLIARAYARKYSMTTPSAILNVFPLSERPSAFRPSNGHEPLRICWFSQTIGEGRGLEDVISAIGMLQEHPIELHLLGQCSAEYREKLEAFAASNRLSPGCIHIHAPIRPDSVVAWTAQYDVGVAAEQPDSINRDICLTNKVFAYLLAGNAVVGTATEAQVKLLSAYPDAGFCYSPGDVACLASKLTAWCEDRDTLTTARRSAWNHGSHRFNWDIEKSKFLKLVEGVLERPARRIA